MNKKQGVLFNGSIRSAGVTVYTKQGRSILRASTSRQPFRRTARQFEARERIAHNNSLWRSLGDAALLSRSEFFFLAAKLPTLYLTQDEHRSGYSLLMPGIPVSRGTLPDIGCRLGNVDGTPALLTDLDPTLLSAVERLRLVVLEQLDYAGLPRLVAKVEKVDAFETVDGCVALVGDRYGNPRFGWALVRQSKRCRSTQTVVTSATAYRAYLGPEAQLRAAASYGGLTTS